MNNMTRAVYGVIVLVFCFGIVFCVPEKAKAKTLDRLRKKVIDSEEIEKQKEKLGKELKPGVRKEPGLHDWMQRQQRKQMKRLLRQNLRD